MIRSNNQQNLNSSNLQQNEYGSFHCSKFEAGKKCDTCKHMRETTSIESYFFKQKFRIHGHLAHDISKENMIRWFVYLIQDLECQKAIVGSTTNPTKSWSAHKSSCNNGPSNSSGLAKHFTMGDGCPNDTGKQKETLNFTLIDYIALMCPLSIW